MRRIKLTDQLVDHVDLEVSENTWAFHFNLHGMASSISSITV